VPFWALLLILQGPPLGPSLDCAAPISSEARNTAAGLFRDSQPALLAANHPAAEPLLVRALALDPLNALAHYALGEVLMARRSYPEAVAAFSRSREAFRCASLLAGEERRAAEARIRDTIRELRDGIRALEDRRLKESTIAWKEVNNDTRTPQETQRALNQLRDRLEELERSLQRGAQAPPGVTLALGAAQFQAGALEAAEREFRAVLAADPGSGDAHNNLAVVCMLTGRLDEASREVKAAEKAGVPVNPRLREELERRKREQPPAAKQP
jgi:tetratricopeptide (TPR) repeat protein